MKTFVQSLKGLAVGLTTLAISIVPSLSFAQTQPNIVTMQGNDYVIDVRLAMTMCGLIPAQYRSLIPLCTGRITTTPTGGTQATGIPVISGLTATGVYNQGGNITWQTNMPTTTALWYRSANNMQWTLLQGPAGYRTNHSISLNSLSANSPYVIITGGTNATGQTGYSGNFSLTTNSLQSNQVMNPTISISNIGGNGATVNVGANMPVRAYVTYGPVGSSTMMTAYSTGYSSGSYGMQNPVTIQNLSGMTNYQGQVYVLDQSGNVVGTQSINWTTQ